MPAGEPELGDELASHRLRPLLGPAFWAVLACAMLCVLAGAGVALLGPKLWVAKPPAAAPGEVK